MLCTTEGLGPKCVSQPTRRGPVIETARLTLRPVQASDAQRIAALAGDITVARMTSSIPHPFPRSAADGFVAKAAQADLAREVLFAVEAEDGDFAGVLGFHSKTGSAPELGYWLGRPYRGRGYMTEAVNGALDWVRDEWGKRYIVAGHFADNPQSGQVLIKAGFLYTGEVLMTRSKARGEDAPTRMMVWLA